MLKNFYYNKTSKEFRPCYKTCKKCLTAGDSKAHNCLECETGYMFRPGDNPRNNCVVYSDFYYLDGYNQYKSMNNLQCPLEAKYLVKDKNYCIGDCKMEKTNKFLYNGNCIESCPDGTINENYKCKESPNKPNLGINSIIINDDDNNYLKVVNTLAKIYVSEFNYTENHVSLYENDKVGVILYKKQSALQEISLDMSKVDFQNCSQKVKDNYNIKGNLLNSVIQKKDKNNPETFYSFYHPISGEKLEVEDLCQNETIVVTENLTSFLNENNTKFKLQMSLTEQGINIFDLNDPFYKDICYDFDNLYKRDIALRDRVKEAYPDAILCAEGCRNQGINLGDMIAKCDCTFKDITQNEIIRENAILDKTIGEVLNVLDDSNILVVKCYKYIIKYFKRSYGGIITCIIIAMNIILTFIFFCFQFRKIAKYAVYQTKKYLKFLSMQIVKYQSEPTKKNNIKQKSEKKEQKRKSKNTGTLKVHNYGSSSDNLNKEKKDEKDEKGTISEYHKTSDDLEEAKKLKNFFNEYLATSPDDMEFDDAIKKDERTFCQCFFDNLKEKQLIANTFIASDPIKKRAVKIILFNLNLILYIVINGLFFSEVYISRLYNIKEDDENFFSFLPRSIERLIYATLVSVIVGYLVDCFFIEEKKIIGILKRETPNKEMIKHNILELIKEIRKRYISFIILVYILLLASLYYLLCFNYVYPKSQMEWIKSSIVIIIIIQILSILKIFFGVLFRYLSFCCDNEYIFKFSKIFN